MSLIMRVFAGMMFERPGRKHDFAEHARILRQKGEATASRIAKGDGSEKHHRVITHIIGIEKWAQSRLRVALGEPLKRDEYDVYRPAKDSDWNELLPTFRATRAESIALAETLAAQAVPKNAKVLHNQFGDFSVSAWLQYIASHADFESRRIAAR